MTFHLAATIADVLTPALSGPETAASDAGGGANWAPRRKAADWAPGHTTRGPSHRGSVQSSEAERSGQWTTRTS